MNIYEGAIIRRLVTPDVPGDPRLDDGNAFRTEWVLEDPQFVALGRPDAPTEQVDWTTNLDLAFHYPRHLIADQRAKRMGPHCYARVATKPEAIADTGDRIPERNLSGGVEKPTLQEARRAGTPAMDDSTKVGPQSGSSAPPAQNETRVQCGCAPGADQQRRIAGGRTPTVKTQALPRSDADETGGVTAGETARILPAERTPSARAVERVRSCGKHSGKGVKRSTSTSRFASRDAGKSFSASERLEAIRESARRTAHEAARRRWYEEGQYA